MKTVKLPIHLQQKLKVQNFLFIKDVAGQSNADLNVIIEKAILVEGDKVTGWALANEDIKTNTTITTRSRSNSKSICRRTG